jgi:SAM-dependent methyltransferase
VTRKYEAMTNQFEHLTEAELTTLDVSLATAHAKQSWDSFYEDHAKPCTFFGTSPDESLSGWVHGGLLRPGRAVELGCGNGRNAIFLARQGFSVEAVDYSKTAVDWASERIAEAGVVVTLRHQSVFDLQLEPATCDLIYDSGCFHHIPPHRRSQYVDLVVSALKPGGWFGLTCFRPEGGSGFADYDVYERRSIGGGLGYTEERLREVWSRGLQVRVVRQMTKPSTESGLFGENFLWVLLAQKA